MKRREFYRRYVVPMQQARSRGASPYELYRHVQAMRSQLMRSGCGWRHYHELQDMYFSMIYPP